MEKEKFVTRILIRSDGRITLEVTTDGQVHPSIWLHFDTEKCKRFRDCLTRAIISAEFMTGKLANSEENDSQ